MQEEDVPQEDGSKILGGMEGVESGLDQSGKSGQGIWAMLCVMFKERVKVPVYSV